MNDFAFELGRAIAISPEYGSGTRSGRADFIVLRESRVGLSVNESELASDIIARSRHHVYNSRVFTAASFFVTRLSPYSYAAFRCAARPISVQRKIVANVAFESFHHRFLEACDNVLGSVLY